MFLQSPYLLLLLVLLPLAAWRLVRREGGGIRFGSTVLLRQLPRTPRLRFRWLVPALRMCAVLLLVVAIARPLQGRKLRTVTSEGIALAMVVDRSGSMRRLDFEIDDRRVSRLEAVRRVAEQFIAGNDELSGRSSDVVGLITFARYADTAAAPTLDHNFIVNKLRQLDTVRGYGQDGTAIGDALGLAVENLHSLGEQNDNPSARKSKVVILLTDGENNAGQLDPLQAARLAQSLEIKVYAISVGPQPRVRGGAAETGDVLTKIAALTGGRAFHASNATSLKQIYKRIDELEKTEVGRLQYIDFREWAIEPIDIAGLPLPALTMATLLLVAFELLLASTVFRTIP